MAEKNTIKLLGDVIEKQTKNDLIIFTTFTFDPIQGGKLEIKGHETRGTDGCKHSGLLLECESSKYPEWNKWGSNVADWKAGTSEERSVCESRSGFYLRDGKGLGQKIWDSNKSVSTAVGAVTLIGAPTPKIDQSWFNTQPGLTPRSLSKGAIAWTGNTTENSMLQFDLFPRAKAGNEWKKQSFVLDTGAQYNPEICLQLFGDDKIAILKHSLILSQTF